MLVLHQLAKLLLAISLVLIVDSPTVVGRQIASAASSTSGCDMASEIKAIVASPLNQDKWTADQIQLIDDAITQAMLESHDGWSSDELILRDELNNRFLVGCHKLLEKSGIHVDSADLNWRLLNLRKAGKLPIKATRRDTRNYDNVANLAEIAARMMEDKHSVSIDRIMTNPALRKEFDSIAQNIDLDVDLYLIRKAAFNLRKARKLQPELITRVADWDRTVSEHSAAELTDNFDVVPTNPGIYIFRDKSGYLYIGEALNLQSRLKKHLEESDRPTLANYLPEHGVHEMMVEIHAFDPESRAKELRVRRAYESELIRSRQPRFNIRP